MAEIRVLMILDEKQRKVVTFSSGMSLPNLAATAFGLDPKNVHLQHFDSDFEEWVLVPDDFTPTNKEKLRVVELQSDLPVYRLVSIE